MEKHVSVVAALQIGLSIFGIIVGIIILVVLNTVGSFVNEREASLVLHLIGTILAVIFFLMSAPVSLPESGCCVIRSGHASSH